MVGNYYLLYIFKKRVEMDKKECLDLSKTIESDLNKGSGEKTYSTQVINGTGFKFLKTVSDYTDVSDILLSDMDNFLNAFLPTI
jgi:hypothetical protein